ncbi:Inositolphosphorylceramide synthase subunit Kei1-domain-containing protein [Mycena floridula]|nr:Inositolphosphorylceramide synthase subunit Kei1-domain-containing protein [Mycena floridula]
MKLTLRPEWRLWPFASFCGLLDLKTGVTVALLFALLNKVAGVYGLIAVLTGAGGSFAQLSLYLYSVAALAALVWGLRAVKEEDPKQTFYFAHLFFADHVVSTSWTVFFAVVWWFQTPHDGQRQVNSDAQRDIIRVAPKDIHQYTPDERRIAAMTIWDHEKGMAFAIILISWLSKIYFALLIYSYAAHLRKGSYHKLPHSQYTPLPVSAHHDFDAGDDDEEVEDFYRIPLRTPQTGGGFADFVNPPPPQRSRRSKSASGASEAGSSKGPSEHQEVLFDQEEQVSYSFASRKVDT